MTELKKNIINIIGVSVAAVITTWTVTVLYKKYNSKTSDSDKKELSIKQDNEVKEIPQKVTEVPAPTVEVKKVAEPIVEIKKIVEPVQEVFKQTPQNVLNTSNVIDKAQELQDKDEDDFTVVKKDDLTDSIGPISEPKDMKNTINITQRDIIVKVEDEDEEEEEESETSSRDSRTSSISEEEVPQATFKPYVRKF